MRAPHLIVGLALVLAVAAFAGTRKAESAAAPPSGATAGVAISSQTTGCRASVYNDAGTINTGGQILYSYYDPTVGWVQSASTLNCTVSATTADGGTRTAFVCPDLQPVANFGRIAAQTYGVIWSDGGTGKTRIECFDPTLLP